MTSQKSSPTGHGTRTCRVPGMARSSFFRPTTISTRMGSPYLMSSLMLYRRASEKDSTATSKCFRSQSYEPQRRYFKLPVSRLIGRLVNVTSKNPPQFHQQKRKHSPKKTAQYWDERVRQFSSEVCR